MLHSIWRFVSANGLNHPAPEWMQRKIVIANRLVFTALFVVTGVFIFSLTDPSFPTKGVAVGYFTQTLIFLLIRFGYFKVARWLLVFAPVTLVSVIALILTPPDLAFPPGRVMLTGMCLLPLVIFDVREWPQMLLAALYPVAVNFAFEPLNEVFRQDFGLSVAHNGAMRHLFLACTFVLMLACVGYLVRITFEAERKNEALLQEVSEKNEELNQNLDLINEQNEELKSSLETIHEQQQNIQDSIHYAWRIQSAIMPNLDLLENQPASASVFYKPRDIVSGDFYWFTAIPNGLVVAGVDCTGHGVPGAFMSVLGRSLLQQAVNGEGLRHPADVLMSLDAGVRETLAQDRAGTTALDGMEVALLTLDYTTRSAHFSGANRPLLIVHPNQPPLQLKGTKKPIGGRNYFETTFENHTFQYEKGTRIFFFSDGITDQMGGPLGRKLGTKRFVELVAATSTLSIDNQAKAIEQFMVQWQGALPQQDDMLLFILEMA